MMSGGGSSVPLMTLLVPQFRFGNKFSSPTRDWGAKQFKEARVNKKYSCFLRRDAYRSTCEVEVEVGVEDGSIVEVAADVDLKVDNRAESCG